VVYLLKLFLLKRTRLPTTAWTSQEITHRLPKRYTQSELKTFFLHSDEWQFSEPHKLRTKEVAEELINRIEKEFL
jgi:hypothetical protein